MRVRAQPLRMRKIVFVKHQSDVVYKLYNVYREYAKNKKKVTIDNTLLFKLQPIRTIIGFVYPENQT